MDYKNSPVERVHLEDSTDPAYIAEVESRIVRKGVVGIVERNGKYLVIQRSEFVPAPLLYSFPGGGIEPGETAAQAARREFREEVGLDVAVTRLLAENRTPSGAPLYWFAARALSDDPNPRVTVQPAEVAEYQWRTLVELLDDPDFLPNNHEIVRGIVEGRIALR